MDKICTICLRPGHRAHACTEELWRLPAVEQEPQPVVTCSTCMHFKASSLKPPRSTCLAASSRRPLWEPQP
jgi:hypothetical protein